MATRKSRLKIKSSVVWLYLNSTPERNLTLVLLSKKKLIKQKHINGGATTEKFLTSLENLLKATKLNIEGIILGDSQLSFSQSRLVMSVANTLAFIWQVPVAKVPAGLAPKLLLKELSKLKFNKTTSLVYKYAGV